MYFLEVHSDVHRIIAVFQCLGTWNFRQSTARRKFIQLLNFIFYSTAPITVGGGALTSDNKEDSAYSTAVAVSLLVHLVRLYYLITSESEILAFIQQVDHLGIVDHNEFNRMNNKIKKIVTFVRFYLIMCTISMTSIFYGVAMENKLPFNIAFPLDYKNGEFGYWMAFTYVVAIVIYGFVMMFFNITIWYLMISFGIQYEVLGNRMRCIGVIEPTKPEAPEQKASDIKQRILFIHELIINVKSHLNTRKKINQFRSCFSNLFFIQIITSGMCICGSVYSLAFSSHENLFLSSFYVLLLVYNMFDIFMIMYLGNEIKVFNGKLSYCFFESNWIQMSQSYKKYIIIFAEILKEPHELVVGFLYPLNLVTFTRIVNLAYQMFNILKNLN